MEQVVIGILLVVAGYLALAFYGMVQSSKRMKETRMQNTRPIYPSQPRRPRG